MRRVLTLATPRVALLATLLLPLPALAQSPGQVNSSSQIVTSGVVAAATATATLPAVAGRTTIITELQITGGGATAASCVTATVTGLVGGTLNYILCPPAGATLPMNPLIVTFGDYGMPATAQGVAITATLPSLGAGNTAAAVNLSGYYQ